MENKIQNVREESVEKRKGKITLKKVGLMALALGLALFTVCIIYL